MTRRAHLRLTVLGFALVYFAAMGGLITLSMPFLEGMREETLAFVILPAAIVGVILSIFAHKVSIDPF